MTGLLSAKALEYAKECDSKRYHITHAIQPHFVFLAFDPLHHVIRYVSDNSPLLFEQPAATMIGQSIRDVFADQTADNFLKLYDDFDMMERIGTGRQMVSVTDCQGRFTRTAIFYRSDSLICVEIEINEIVHPFSQMWDYVLVQQMQRISAYEGGSAGLSSEICRTIKEITGYERVWYCEFDKEGHGYVSGECTDEALPSLMRHHFPATDIPQSVRPLYAKNRFRAMADIRVSPASIVNEMGDAAQGLDLTFSLARMPGATHLAYLENMGVRASASFSVVEDGQLKALFGAHSKKPIPLGCHQLIVCQHLADRYRVIHDWLWQGESKVALDSKESSIRSIVDVCYTHGFDAQSFNQSKVLSRLSDLLKADGCLVYHYGTWAGDHAFEKEVLSCLAETITAQLVTRPIFTTASLESYDTRFQEWRQDVCGVCAGRLDSSGHAFILWYRAEHAYAEKWAGNPSEAVQKDEAGVIGPRQSFESWVRTVEGKSVTWSSTDIRTIERLLGTYTTQRNLYYGQLGQKSAKQLNAIVNTVVDGIITIDESGIVQAFNRAAERIFGYMADEVIGQNVKMLIPDQHRVQHDGYLEHYMTTGEAKIIGIGREVQVRRKDGVLVPVRLGIGEVQLEKERLFVGTIHDITERKRYEEQLRDAKDEAERANVYKSQFLANMSHELRTPLHTMLGFVESMIEKMGRMPQEKQLEYLGVVQSSSERLLLLINDLLDLAKLEAGMMRFSYAEHSFVTMVQDCVRELQYLIDQKQLVVTVSAPSDDPLMAIFDRERMKQVVINLLSNAIKFTPEHKAIELILTAPGSVIRCEVCDQGVGVPESELENIFDPFIQSSQTQTGAGGTGLGLSICTEIMTAHQGRVWAENRAQAGACFVVEFPQSR